MIQSSNHIVSKQIPKQMIRKANQSQFIFAFYPFSGQLAQVQMSVCFGGHIQFLNGRIVVLSHILFVCPIHALKSEPCKPRLSFIKRACLPFAIRKRNLNLEKQNGRSKNYLHSVFYTCFSIELRIFYVYIN